MAKMAKMMAIVEGEQKIQMMAAVKYLWRCHRKASLPLLPFPPLNCLLPLSTPSPMRTPRSLCSPSLLLLQRERHEVPTFLLICAEGNDECTDRRVIPRRRSFSVRFEKTNTFKGMEEGDKILSEGFEVNTLGKTNSSNTRSYNRAEPSEGMNFENANDTMTFYNTYGRNVGFDTCVISSKWKDGKCIFRHLCCWRNGKSRRNAEAKNHRDSPKIGCNASVKVKVDKSSGKHVFYELILEHNHALNPGMSSSQRSESIHHFFDGFVQSKTTLGEFIDKYSVALDSRYDAENEVDVKTMETAPFLRTSSPFEKQASSIYTRGIFMKFQEELIEIASYVPTIIHDDDKKLTMRIKSFENIKVKHFDKTIAKEFTMSVDRTEDLVAVPASVSNLEIIYVSMHWWHFSLQAL
ncbi:hypothetical protein Taro_039350 [Colocasia esculenta]|uniref:Protein FAR1-RELATED SEQUENCE n=1 Tax=Colocasia esculenta TaxID=4460 RepID=A0A843W664_COLES|nr:hypothetical protein [Colocasia esculenta]